MVILSVYEHSVSDHKNGLNMIDIFTAKYFASLLL